MCACQADDLGLKSLQQIIAEAERKAAVSEGFVKMTLSPRGLKIGFPLLEPAAMSRSYSAPAWARPASTTDIGRTSSISRTSATIGSSPRRSRTHISGATQSPGSPSGSRSPMDYSPPASPRSPSAYLSPRCVGSNRYTTQCISGLVLIAWQLCVYP